MIVFKKLEQVVGENRTLPLDVGGELESYIAKAVQQLMLQNFGIVVECEVKKE